MVNKDISFWKNKRVLITGHTGFKGSWLMIWLQMLGAEVFGYSLNPQHNPSLFGSISEEYLIKNLTQRIEDIRNKTILNEFIKETKPEIVFHMAAQSLVKQSYIDPLNTWETNVIGSLNLLEALKDSKLSCSVVMVTTDKVYKNNEWTYGYREEDPLGGHDPYSASKAAMEIAISSWRDSFINSLKKDALDIRIATARSGNVIGGGDWALDRIVPDTIRSIIKKETLILRNPASTRPWQHVLEPLWGYMILAKSLHNFKDGFSEPFNFGPNLSSNREVKEVVKKIFKIWSGKYINNKETKTFHEANKLYLHSDKAFHKLNWITRMDFNLSIEKTIEWYKNNQYGKKSLDCCIDDINFYMNLLSNEI